MAKIPQLVDQFGQPIDRSRLLEEQAAPSLASVRNIIAGHPAEGLTPTRLGQLLRASEQTEPIPYLELAEQMEERDLHYLGVLGHRKRAIAQLDMTVEPASTSADDKAAGKLIETFLNRLELQDELFNVLDAVGKGYSVTEILWDTSEGQWMPKRLEWRDPRWFRFSLDDGETLELWDNAGYLPMAPYQFIVNKMRAKSGIAIRGGLARVVAWAYLFKNFDIKSWVMFAESFGQPIRVGKYGPGASSEDKAVLLRAVRSLSQDVGAIIPQSMMLDLIEAKMTGSTDLYEKTANWWDQQVSKAVLGNTGTTDAIAGGHAVGRTHKQVEDSIAQADARALEAVLNRDLVRPMIDLNMGPREQYPMLRIVVDDGQQILQNAQAVAVLVDRGLLVSQQEIRRKCGLTEPAPGDDLLHPVSAAAGNEAPPSASAGPPPATGGVVPPQGGIAAPGGAGMAANAALPDPAIAETDSIDDLIARQLADWRVMVAPLLSPVLELAAQCRSYEEFLTGLPGVVPKQDAGALTEALARSMFAAALHGQFDANGRG